MPTIALTGNFGTGKTSVLGLFQKLGAHTFNIDGYVHDIHSKPETIRAITELLGDSILCNGPNGPCTDKKRVADIIFNDPEKRRAVEKIIHPAVMRIVVETESRISRENPSALIMFEVPLLYEAGYDKYFEKVIVVYCKRDIVLERLAKKGFSREDALKRLSAQMPITRKMKRGDYVIDNSEDLKTTEKKVAKVFRELTL